MAKPYAPPNPFGVNQVYWERIQAMRLMDDTLTSAALDKNIEATRNYSVKHLVSG